MNYLNLLAAGMTDIIIYAAIALVVIIVIAIIIRSALKKKKKALEVATSTERAAKALKFSGDNTKLVQVIDVIQDYNDCTLLIVDPYHNALMIRNGQIKFCPAGSSYPLYSEEEGLRKQDVLDYQIVFISKTVKLMLKWGTMQQDRIEYREPKLDKIVSIGAFGEMEIQVERPLPFQEQVVANFGAKFTDEDLRQRVLTIMKSEVMNVLRDVLTEQNMSYLDFVNANHKIQQLCGNVLRNKFVDEYGFTVHNFIISQINMDEESKNELLAREAKRRSEKDEREDIVKEREKYRDDRAFAKEIERDQHEDKKQAYADAKDLAADEDFFYDREKNREREEDAYQRGVRHAEEDRQRGFRHEDENREWAREDTKWAQGDKAAERNVNAGTHIVDQHYDAVKKVGWEPQVAATNDAVNAANQAVNNVAPAAGAGHFCRVCGTGYRPSDTYCPGCGATLDKPGAKKVCPVCGSENPTGNNYCGRCNHKFK